MQSSTGLRWRFQPCASGRVTGHHSAITGCAAEMCVRQCLLASLEKDAGYFKIACECSSVVVLCCVCVLLCAGDHGPPMGDG